MQSLVPSKSGRHRLTFKVVLLGHPEPGRHPQHPKLPSQKSPIHLMTSFVEWLRQSRQDPRLEEQQPVRYGLLSSCRQSASGNMSAFQTSHPH